MDKWIDGWMDNDADLLDSTVELYQMLQVNRMPCRTTIEQVLTEMQLWKYRTLVYGNRRPAL